MSDYIYFDNSATTPLDPRVATAMQPYLSKIFGNPSSLHGPGRKAREAVDKARKQVAALINAQPDEIFFTGSGTEADNMALRGVAEAIGFMDCHIITSAIEHPAILATCKHLERRGVQISYLPIDSEGVVRIDALPGLIRPTTRLVSVMAANNVVGTIQRVNELAKIAHEHGALFHTDAVQAVGKTPLDASSGDIDLISISAHKLNGPKGVGALFASSRIRERLTNGLAPIIFGGGQEQGLRSATENVAGVVGFGEAARIAKEEMAEEATRLVGLRDRILEGILTKFPNAYLIGSRYRRLPGHLCLGFGGMEGEAIKLLLALDEAGIAVSTGSACSASHASEPSYILLAMGFDVIRARGSLRVTLGRFNTEEETDKFLSALERIVPTLRTITGHSAVTAVP
jgi:cysteine desulfurase